MSEQEIRTFHPSSLGYLQVCPRFVNDETRDDTASKRGTMLHEMVATGQGDLTPLTEDDRTAVVGCREYLRNIVNKKTADVSLQKEVPLHSRLGKMATLLGKTDVLILDAEKRYATVIDWKFGYGAVIAARQNPQVMSYARMVFAMFPTVDAVTTTLVCPLQEDNLVDTYVWDKADIPVIDIVLENIVTRVMDPAQEPVLNWSVCRYCGAKATCSKMCQVMLRTSEVTSPVTVLELLAVKHLDPDTRSKWQQVAEWAGDWAKQVKRKNLDAVLSDGEEIEGYGVVRRKGSLKIENTAQAVERLVSFGYDRNIVMAACALSLPSLTEGLENLPDEQKGGVTKKEIREKLEALLKQYLREGEPVVYLKRVKSKNKKPKEIE